MNKENKYVMAIIKIPIKIFDEETPHEIMNDRITIDIEPCLHLPDPKTLDNIDLRSQIFSLHKNNQPTPTELETDEQLKSETKCENLETIMQILYHEKIPKHPKNRQNMTFKNNQSKPRHSHTRRVY